MYLNIFQILCNVFFSIVNKHFCNGEESVDKSNIIVRVYIGTLDFFVRIFLTVKS